jgi:hypothetical protein
VGVRYEPGNIDEVDRNKAAAVNAVRTSDFQVGAGTRCPHIGNAKIRVNGGERVVGDLGIRHCGSLEKGRFPTVGFSRKGKGNHGSSSNNWDSVSQKNPDRI